MRMPLEGERERGAIVMHRTMSAAFQQRIACIDKVRGGGDERHRAGM